MSNSVTFAVIGLLVVSTMVSGLPMVLQPVHDADAVCNDGSPYGYYFRPSSCGSDVWVLHLEGGFWCWDAGKLGLTSLFLI